MKHYFLLAIALFCTQILYSQTYLEQAQEALNNGDYDQVYEFAKKQLEITPANPDALVFLAHVYAQRGQHDDAIQTYTLAFNLCNKQSVITRDYISLCLGYTYQLSGDYSTAIDYYNYAIKLNKNYVDAYSYRAHAYWAVEEYKKADSDFRKVLKMDPNNASELESYGRFIFTQTGDPQRALPYINKALDIEPRFSYAYNTRSRMYYFLEDYEKAIEDAIYNLGLENNDDYGLFLDCAQENMDHAFMRLTQLINDPRNNDGIWYGARAQLYIWKEEFNAAIDDLCQQEVMNGGPNEQIVLNRANCYIELDKFNEAIRDYTRAIEFNPTTYAYAMREYAYGQIGDHANAINDITYILEHDSTVNTDVLYQQRAWNRMLIKDKSGARADFEKILETNDSMASVCYYYGDLLVRLGDTINGKPYIERAIELEAENPSDITMFSLAILGRTNEAIAAIKERIVSIEDITDFYNTACAYSRLNMPDEALLYLHLVLENGYNHFIHIEADWDLDNIRQLPEFKKLIEKYNKK